MLRLRLGGLSVNCATVLTAARERCTAIPAFIGRRDLRVSAISRSEADAGAPRRNPTVAEMANNEFSLLDIARQYDTSVPAVVPQKPKPPPQGNGERERQSERRARDARQYTSQKKPPPPPPRVNPPPSGVNRSSRRVALKNAPILPEVEKRLQRVNLLQQTGRVRRAARAAAKSAETGEITPAEKLFEKKLLFKGSAAKESELPRLKMDEIAFVGRSNVGKSSLLNALAGPRGNPAVVEDKPGTTRCANFYAVQKQMCLVDLPGYGFAYADTTSKEQWASLLTNYLKNRTNLKRVFVLIDARHGVKSTDTEFMNFLDLQTIPYTIVMTKADLCPPKNIAKTIYILENDIAKHTHASPRLIPFSVKVPETASNLKTVLYNMTRPPVPIKKSKDQSAIESTTSTKAENLQGDNENRKEKKEKKEREVIIKVPTDSANKHSTKPKASTVSRLRGFAREGIDIDSGERDEFAKL